MDTQLLRSKVRLPPAPAELVPRPQLQTAIEREIMRYRLVLIAAPAGYGKTTLLAEWARSSKLRVAWLSVTGEEDGLERFLRYLLAAWETVQPEIVETPLGIQLGSLNPDIRSVLSAFLDAAGTTTSDLAFVLDDYHLIEDPAIHESLTFLLDHLPARVHFVLASRGEPPLPLARYRARRQLLEYRTEDLQFTQDESAEFLTQLAGIAVSSEQALSLHNRTEGWIAGLQLAALSMRGGQGIHQLAPIVSGRQRFIADYLAGDVLTHLPAGVQDFLLKTSILDRLSGPLCDAVTGATGGQVMLESLEREYLFIVPLDAVREWYRYHSLFAEFLQGELARRLPAEVERLHSRAAEWYLAHELPEQAFQHAVKGSKAELVVHIISDYMNAKLMAGELRVVERWINALPAEWEAAYPVLGLARAGFLAFSGAYEASARCVDEVEQKLLPAETDSKRWQMARVTAVRCLMACERNDLSQAEVYAYRALDELPEDDLGFRPGIFAALGDSYRQNGRWAEAKECYLKVLGFTRSPSVRVRSAHVYGALADLVLRQGRLREAMGYWKRALDVIQAQGTWNSNPLPVIGWVYIRMGEILYEWDQIAESADRVACGLERAEMGGDVRTLIAGYLAAGRLQLAEGDIQAAGAYLERARPLVEKASFSEWTGHFERFQAALWLAEGKLRIAADWADKVLQSGDHDGRPEHDLGRLTIARILIAKNDLRSLERAQTLLEHLLAAAGRDGRNDVMIETLALQALAAGKLGAQAGAMTSLERALRLAEPEGYTRLFADLGLPMARLLQAARAREVMVDYLDRLLAAFGGNALVAAVRRVPEPLTGREQEVLELIAAGLTNREIAEALVLSPETVKKHTGNIYGKLGVGTRTQAIARARELDLLE